MNLTQTPMYSHEAFDALLKRYAFKTVLDIGCGSGTHSRGFQNAGKDVTALDINPPKDLPVRTIISDYTAIYLEGEYDCVWLSHVLEHQLDTHSFLRKVHGNLAEGGVLAVTVPPMKNEIVGGHVSLWNMGLLLYRLVLAGFDCGEAIGKSYDYNISVLVKKRTIEIDWGCLNFDAGDIAKLSKFFPQSRIWKEGFRGDILNLNW